MFSAVKALRDAVCLAWRAGVDGINVSPQRICEVTERVGLNEFEGVPGLRPVVDADDVEPGPVVSHGGAAGAAEQVKQPRAGHVGHAPSLSGSYVSPTCEVIGYGRSQPRVAASRFSACLWWSRSCSRRCWWRRVTGSRGPQWPSHLRRRRAFRRGWMAQCAAKYMTHVPARMVRASRASMAQLTVGARPVMVCLPLLCVATGHAGRTVRRRRLGVLRLGWLRVVRLRGRIGGSGG